MKTPQKLPLVGIDRHFVEPRFQITPNIKIRYFQKGSLQSNLYGKESYNLDSYGVLRHICIKSHKIG